MYCLKFQNACFRYFIKEILYKDFLMYLIYACLLYQDNTSSVIFIPLKLILILYIGIGTLEEIIEILSW